VTEVYDFDETKTVIGISAVNPMPFERAKRYFFALGGCFVRRKSGAWALAFNGPFVPLGPWIFLGRNAPTPSTNALALFYAAIRLLEASRAGLVPLPIRIIST